ncbi:MAG: alkaline phosphatase family protein [Flavobacteriales bacterium]|jgi:hypothetical protein
MILRVVLPIIFLLFSCKRDKIAQRNYQSENLVIIVMDGARYSETFGDTSHAYIPLLWNSMRDSGVIFTEFYNQGTTFTMNGHVAMTTGFYQEIPNDGTMLPNYPSLFQYWNKKNDPSGAQSWLICSKDKLEVLGNTNDYRFKNQYLPSSDCGNAGNGSGYRSDSITFLRALSCLENQKPNLLLVNFKEPDFSGHTGNWNAYVEGIQKTDAYAFQLWQYLQTDPHYKGKTTFLFTNDHGRHDYDFKNHGDQCQGCKHLFLYAEGPDFRKGATVNQPYSLVDLHATCKELLHLLEAQSTGKVIQELFK